jgi:hypothetical protein
VRHVKLQSGPSVEHPKIEPIERAGLDSYYYLICREGWVRNVSEAEILYATVLEEV